MLCFQHTHMTNTIQNMNFDAINPELSGHGRVPKGYSDPRYLAQSAGWMSSPREIMQLHTKLCNFNMFLPPFEGDRFPRDGLHRHNVEFFSGGIQLWCGFCNMQRIVLLDPQHFSKHLIYHTANNKQKRIKRDRLVRATDLFGQLHTIKDEAATVPRAKH